MLQHILKVFFRNTMLHKRAFLVNVIGLASALACGILIWLWIADEYSIDKFNKNDRRLYLIMENEKTPQGIVTKTGTAEFLARALPEEIDDIETSCVATPSDFFPAFSFSDGEKHVEGIGKFADDNFFNVFSYPIASGNNSHLLKDQNAVVLSESMANKLFGRSAAIGKTLKWNLQNIIKEVTVTGVMKDVSSHASEKFDFVLSIKSFEEIMNIRQDYAWRDGGPFSTCVVLKEKSDLTEFNNRLAGLLVSKDKSQQHRTLFAKRYSKNYLYGQYENGKESGGRITQVKVFAILAAMVMFLATINFVNMITARASVRVKEVGIKKAIGAARRSIMLQYFSESVLAVIFSLIVALPATQLLIPKFNQLAGKTLSLDFTPLMIAGILVIAVITALAAGVYPAVYLSKFKPVVVLKGLPVSSSAEQFVRKGLVVFQFTITSLLMICVFVIYQQTSFMQSQNPGYDKENVVYFESNGAISRNPESFLAEAKAIPGVDNASSMIGNLVGGSGTTESGGGDVMDWNGKQIRMQSSIVNFELLETMGLKIRDGRSFKREIDIDTNKVILNKAAIDAMELKDPIGKRLPGRNAEIIGVVEDFNYQSLKMPVKPFIFVLSPHYAVTIMIRMKKGAEHETLPDLKNLFDRFNPGYSFDYHFLDHAYKSQYAEEERMQFISQYLAVLAIIISCLGLLSLAHFSAARRLKEMSIRKILGSGEWNIVYLLSGDFIKIIGASIAIALPSGYFIASWWLQGFAFRIELTWLYFAVPVLLMALIALLIISNQFVRTSKISVTEVLKRE